MTSAAGRATTSSITPPLCRQRSERSSTWEGTSSTDRESPHRCRHGEGDEDHGVGCWDAQQKICPRKSGREFTLTVESKHTVVRAEERVRYHEPPPLETHLQGVF